MTNWRAKLVYFVVVLAVGWGVTALLISGAERGHIEGWILGPFIWSVVAAALTFPLGLIPYLACLLAVYAGLITPIEFVALSTPLCALAGILQWFWALPTIFRRRAAPYRQETL